MCVSYINQYSMKLLALLTEQKLTDVLIYSAVDSGRV